MADANSRPLVSLIMLAYRHEHFIAESVRSVLAQTYSPLEILISDDNSPDGTAKVIRETVAAYQGPHSVIVNVNQTNLGMMKHVMSLMRRAQGELVVMAGGDDISEPNRVEALVERWLKADRPAAISSGVRMIDERGQNLDALDAGHYEDRLFPAGVSTARLVLRKELPVRLRGATAAYRPKLWEDYTAFSDAVYAEDFKLWFRAALSTGILTLSEPLVRYRQHSGSWTGQTFQGKPDDSAMAEEKQLQFVAKKKGMLETFLIDVDDAARLGFLNGADQKRVRRLVEEQISIQELKLKWWRESWFRQVFSIIPRVLPIASRHDLRWFFKRLLQRRYRAADHP